MPGPAQSRRWLPAVAPHPPPLPADVVQAPVDALSMSGVHSPGRMKRRRRRRSLGSQELAVSQPLRRAPTGGGRRACGTPRLCWRQWRPWGRGRGA